MSLQFYVGGDMLLRGSQMLREKEKEDLQAIGATPYAPQDDKEINDKSNQSEENNNGLAEKIFYKDTMAMINSDVLIFEVANNNVGTCVEIGQWAMIHMLHEMHPKNELLAQLASKPVLFHSTDVRDTDIPEASYRRSHSYNQYLVGALIKANPLGILQWDDVLKECKQILIDRGEV